jgi:hypothetical protein
MSSIAKNRRRGDDVTKTSKDSWTLVSWEPARCAETRENSVDDCAKNIEENPHIHDFDRVAKRAAPV